MSELYTLLCGDAAEQLRTLPPASVQCVVTSPPYFGLRDYGVAGQIGLEATLEEYVNRLVAVFAEVWRVLRPDGTVWLNLGDSYANDGKWGGHTGGLHAAALHASPVGRNKCYTGMKPKELMGVPWRVAFALQAAGWYLRSDIIWAKTAPMPESVTDRPTRAHEYVFLVTKSARYYYDADAIREPHTALGRPPGNKSRIFLDRDPQHHTGEKRRPGEEHSFHPLGRNKRDVWTLGPSPYPEAHFATMPESLVGPCVLAGSAEGDTVLDPFIGSGTVAAVALRLRRRAIGIDLNPEYLKLAERRIWDACPEVRGQQAIAFEAAI